MAKPIDPRMKKNLPPRSLARLRRQRKQIAGELPALIEHDQMRKDARDEPTLSGELRRAVHASPMSLAKLAAHAGIMPPALDEFLTGERTLRSDVMDRLAHGLGFHLANEPGRRGG